MAQSIIGKRKRFVHFCASFLTLGPRGDAPEGGRIEIFFSRHLIERRGRIEKDKCSSFRFLAARERGERNEGWDEKSGREENSRGKRERETANPLNRFSYSNGPSKLCESLHKLLYVNASPVRIPPRDVLVSRGEKNEARNCERIVATGIRGAAHKAWHTQGGKQAAIAFIILGAWISFFETHVYRSSRLRGPSSSPC